MKRIQSIIEKAFAGERISKEECGYMLSLPPASFESSLIRGAADTLIRRKNNNAAIIIGQVGIDIHPCAANCGFCSFGKDYSTIPDIRLEKGEVLEAIEKFRRADDLYGIYLMTMADTPRDYILDTVSYAAKNTGSTT